MKVRIQALGQHLRHLLHIVAHHMLQKLLQTTLGIHLLQLLLIQVQHLIHSPLEL